jgi:hypothetical protein
MGAAEDGRAPTEELSCVCEGDFCSTGGSFMTFLVRFAVLPDTSHLLQNRLCHHGFALGS